MQISIDGLLVALLVVLAPEQEPASERAVTAMALDPQRGSAIVNDSSACRLFADVEARRKCTIRTSRPALSGAAERDPLYPETVIWLAPSEPAMPYKFPSNPPR